MKRLSILFAALALVACEKQAESVRPAGQGFQVERLFTVDGCTVYRFDDARTVYFTNCKGEAMSSYQESCGKSCTRTVDIDARGTQ